VHWAAIPSQGRITVEAERSERGVELRVRDDGTGIDPDFLPRIFEPHFSTRSMGTGLGLAIVRRLVESWGGNVSAESTPGEGTVIRIVVPVWSGGETASVTPREEGEA
jgi:signal transduction histidine kinase